jgi:hypothetical protein
MTEFAQKCLASSLEKAQTSQHVVAEQLAISLQLEDAAYHQSRNGCTIGFDQTFNEASDKRNSLLFWRKRWFSTQRTASSDERQNIFGLESDFETETDPVVARRLDPQASNARETIGRARLYHGFDNICCVKILKKRW